MELANTIIGAVGTFAALITVGFAWAALRAAKDTLRGARDVQREAGLNQRRQRVLQVGEAIAGLRAVGWRDPLGVVVRRQQLAVALVGLVDRLPLCAAALNETDSEAVDAAALVALDEVQRELRWIDEQLTRLP